VDGRDKHGHDDFWLLTCGTITTIFSEPDTRGLVPAIHVVLEAQQTWMPGTSQNKSGHDDPQFGSTISENAFKSTQGYGEVGQECLLEKLFM
jgi:hypothetical protein